MATVTIDTTTVLSAEEVGGVVVGLTRQGIVSGLTDGDVGILASALTALDGQGHTVGSSDSHYPSVVLASRSISLIPQENKVVEVELGYVHTTMNEWQAISSDETPIILVETSLEQIMTPKEFPFDAENPTLLSVEHTYPDDHDTQAGRTVTQGGEMQITVPRQRAVLKGLVTAGAVGIFKYMYLLNKVNNDTWFGGIAGTWLCTKADVQKFDIANSKYKCHFEFEYKQEGWDPIVAFVDPETGRIPNDLVQGTGWKIISANGREDFSIVGSPDL